MHYSLFYLSNLVSHTTDAEEAIQWMIDVDDKEQEYCLFVADDEGDILVGLIDSRTAWTP